MILNRRSFQLREREAVMYSVIAVNACRSRGRPGGSIPLFINVTGDVVVEMSGAVLKDGCINSSLHEGDGI